MYIHYIYTCRTQTKHLSEPLPQYYAVSSTECVCCHRRLHCQTAQMHMWLLPQMLHSSSSLVPNVLPPTLTELAALKWPVINLNY